MAVSLNPPGRGHTDQPTGASLASTAAVHTARCSSSTTGCTRRSDRHLPDASMRPAIADTPVPECLWRICAGC